MSKPHIMKAGDKWILIDASGYQTVFDTFELAASVAKYRHKFSNYVDSFIMGDLYGAWGRNEA